MIAKAATISHGGNAVRYSVNNDKAEIVKVNFLPDDISAEAEVTETEGEAETAEVADSVIENGGQLIVQRFQIRL